MIDLKRHAWRYKLNGFPIYGDWEGGEEDVIIGYVSEQLWKWADLSEADQATVLAQAATYRADERSGRMTEDEVFGLALGDYAIACPHLRWTYHEPVFRECNTCRATEQLPGIRVRVGDRVMRVSDPPPRILRIPVPTVLHASLDQTTPVTAPELRVVEWRWTGTHYV